MTVEFSPGSCAFLSCAAHDQNVHSFVLLCCKVDGENNGATVWSLELCRIHHQQQDISDIFTYCSVVLCAQRVDCRTGFGTHHGARAWFGVACARRYMTMASGGVPSSFTSPLIWPLGAMCALRRIGIGRGDGSADFFS